MVNPLLDQCVDEQSTRAPAPAVVGRGAAAEPRLRGCGRAWRGRVRRFGGAGSARRPGSRRHAWCLRRRGGGLAAAWRTSSPRACRTGCVSAYVELGRCGRGAGGPRGYGRSGPAARRGPARAPCAAPAVWLDGLVVGLGLCRGRRGPRFPRLRAAATPRTPDVGPGRHPPRLSPGRSDPPDRSRCGRRRHPVAGRGPPCPAGSGAGHQPPHRPRPPSARPGRPLPRRRSRRPRLVTGPRSRRRRGLPRAAPPRAPTACPSSRPTRGTTPPTVAVSPPSRS